MVRVVLFGFAVFLVLTATAPADEKAAIARIEEIGGSVRPIAANDDSKDVDFHLSGTALTDDGLSHVSQLSNVVWLNLKDTQITDAGLQHLTGLTGLKRLHLERTAVTDGGLVHLVGLAQLEYLNLYGTKVTDAGLEHLVGLKNLKRLYLWQSEVTQAGADRLKKALPDLAVNLGGELKPVIVKPVEPPGMKKDPPPTKSLAKGQFVRVRLEGSGKVLTLSEVHVIETDSGKTLHAGAKASQSSVDFGGEAARAIDGNVSQAFSENSSTHTTTEAYPWWLVDLGNSRDIGRIKIWNRSDCCGIRLADAIVEVLSADKQVVWSGRVQQAADGSVHVFEST